ncbi:MAG: S41 family peptidase [Flavobacteriales bacterium]|nr:S41 family peptidase [Flavobacteriales bacterium]
MKQHLASWTLLFFVLISFGTQAQIPHNNRSATTDKFNTLLNYISQMYVDSVQEDQLVEQAIITMLEQLDPHSIYIPKEEVEEMNAPLKGGFDGIGVRFQIMKDTIMVVNPVPGGPSEKLGIKAGDKIITVDGQTVAGVGIKNNQVREKLLGIKGTKVTVEIARRGEKKLLKFTITRDKIPLYSVDAAYMADPETGYIKLNNFGEHTMEEFNRAIDSLKGLGMKHLILDLQGNGGGYLNTAIDLCDEFLSGTKLIVYTEGRAFSRKDTYARKLGKFETGKLVVLIDESSASASEIVSGAIQDWDRGLIVGRRSFGKGLVQKPVNLPDGSQVRLTTQRYYTPTGRCIQKPYEDGSEEYHKEKYQRYLSGEMISKDSIKIPDSLHFETRINKRTVYGAGGIIPDVFVPIDTSMNSDYLSGLLRGGVFNNFCLTYVDNNRKALKKSFPDFQKFKKGFVVDKKLMDEFTAYAEKEGVKFDPAGYATSKMVIDIRIKAGIAQNLWDYPMFYEIVNPLNPTYRKGLEAIKDGTYENLKLTWK